MLGEFPELATAMAITAVSCVAGFALLGPRALLFILPVAAGSFGYASLSANGRMAMMAARYEASANADCAKQYGSLGESRYVQHEREQAFWEPTGTCMVTLPDGRTVPAPAITLHVQAR